MASLELRAITLEIGGRTVCRDLSLAIDKNERWALLGKNGAGKTTLLHSLIALHEPAAGQILIKDTLQQQLTRRQLAQAVGILFQEGMHSMPSTVMESVLLGRHPHTHSLLLDDARDMAIAREALRSLDLETFAERQVDSLSGGEKQRLALAMLIAQTPDIYLLDEPSNHLDLAFQVKLLSTLARRIIDQSACLLMATHDINLAARFCDRFILLMGDGTALVGTRDEVLTEASLSAAYECDMQAIVAGEMRFYYPKIQSDQDSATSD